MEEPSYFAVIPAYIRYCKQIEMGAKLLYGEITALANKYGFCWASNQYFADLYQVDVRTIKNWISSLKSENFIKVEIEKEGMQTKRKIWISHEVQKMFTKGNNFHPEGKISSPRGEKNFTHNNTVNNTSTKENIIKERPSKKRKKIEPEPAIERDKNIFTTDFEHQKLCEKIGEDKLKLIYDAMAIWKNKNGIVGGNDYATAKNWDLDLVPKKPHLQTVPNQALKDREFAIKLSKIARQKGFDKLVSVLSDCIQLEFFKNSPNGKISLSESYVFGEFNFEEKIKNSLARMNFIINDDL